MATRTVRENRRLAGAILLAVIVALTTMASGSEYTPPGLYDVDYFKLENGLDVVLKRRAHAHNVAVRLVISVGFRNFPCAKRETPHFLEHLLFTGTSKHTEAQLNRLIEDHGGDWNGATSTTETQYKIDIFDKYLPVAVNTLYEIITDTAITPEKVESTREIIHRERAGKHSRLYRWLYQNGIGKPAYAKARELLLPGTDVGCPGLITPEGISQADVKEAYKTYYIPANMTLVVVGNFDREKLVSQMKSTFGRLTPRVNNGSKMVTPPYPDVAKEVTGTLAPLLGSDGRVGFAYRTEGMDSPDFYTLTVLWVYLDRALYERLRVDRALSYGPGSTYYYERDYGIFSAVADANLDKLEAVKALLEVELEKLRLGQVKTEEMNVAKQRILLALAKGYESNSGIADYYVENLHQLKTNGKLTHHEAVIASLTPEDIQRVADKYLRNDRRVIIRSRPTLTYTQFYVGLGFVIAMIPGTGFYLFRRILRRRRRQSRCQTP